MNDTTTMDGELAVDELEASFALLAPEADALVERFYGELFERHPAVIPLFSNADMPMQRARFLASLKLVVGNLRNPEVLLAAVKKMGVRHQAYGARPEHYQLVAETLLAVLAEFSGSAWTPMLQQAWSDALGLIARTMLSGYSAEMPSRRSSNA